MKEKNQPTKKPTRRTAIKTVEYVVPTILTLTTRPARMISPTSQAMSCGVVLHLADLTGSRSVFATRYLHISIEVMRRQANLG
jgi:hypothetical protein